MNVTTGSASLMIEVEGVSKAFGGQPVLHDMTFRVKEGEIIGLLGPNGAGKTTMVRLLNGVILPDAGTIRVGGMDPSIHGDTIRGMSGIVTEGAGLYHEMSAAANLHFFAELYGCREGGRIGELLSRFGLEEHQDKPVGTFSTGMKKRLALAKALLHRPRLLFLDEPTNGLDPDGVRLVLGILRQLNREEGTTILLCSHVLHQLETVCGGYVFLDGGRIIDAGTLPEMEAKYLKQVELSVETGLQPAGASFAGYACRRAGPNRLMFTLPGKDCISPLLTAILRESWVYTAEIDNRSLESLYFEIRKAGGRNE
jgi:ABC-2 type transport system ATP-binding protein